MKMQVPTLIVGRTINVGTIRCRLVQDDYFSIFSASLRASSMFFEPNDGDAAGLIVSKSPSTQYSFYRIPTGLSLHRMNEQGPFLLAETELPDFVTRVYLRVECNNNHFTFFYRYEGSGPDDWTQVGDAIDITSDSSSDVDATLIGLCAEQFETK